MWSPRQTTCHPVTRERHGHLTWHPPRDFVYSAQLSRVPLAQVELKRACTQFPVAFERTTNGWQVVALIGTSGGDNLVCDGNNRGTAAYVPARLRAYPFTLGKGRRPLLCVDENSGLVSSNYDGKPFFDASGALSPRLQTVRRFLRHLESGRKVAGHHAAELSRLALLEPWHEASTLTGLPGLYRANIPQLSELLPEMFLELQPAGRLKLLFAQNLSEHRLGLLKAVSQQPADPASDRQPSDRRQTATKAVSELVQLMSEEGPLTDSDSTDT